MVAMVEGFEAERVGGARGPQPQRVHVAAAPADDGGVVGDGVDRLGRGPDLAWAITPLRALDDRHATAEADVMRDLGPRELPRVAEGQPVLRHLALPPAHNLLGEQAVIVADAVAKSRNAQAGQAFHKARRQSAQPAIAQRRIGLGRPHLVERHAQQGQRIAHLVGDAQVADVVAQQPADQEFQAEVIDLLGLAFVAAPGGAQPAFDDLVARGQRGGEEPVAPLRAAFALAHVEDQLAKDALAQRLGVRRWGVQGGDGCGGRDVHGRLRRSVGRTPGGAGLTFPMARRRGRVEPSSPPEAQSLCDMSAFDRGAGRQVGDGARHAQGADEAASGQAQAFGRLFGQRLGGS